MKDLVNKAYIQAIKTKGLRNIEDLNLTFYNDSHRHIIITGDNGVGKTTFVNELYNSLIFYKETTFSLPNQAFRHLIKDLPDKKLSNIQNLEEILKNRFLKESIEKFCAKTIVLPDCVQTAEFAALTSSNEFLVLYFDARRSQQFITPEGPKKIPSTAGSKQFIQSMVNLQTQASYANLKKDFDKVKRIEEWFKRLKDSLAVLLGHDEFELEFLDEEFNFVIKEKNKEPYYFTQLSDGYSAIISMVAEIMLRMSTGPLPIYDKPGIVIIDEIETHLHVSLQRKIFPFLIKLFPNIQFVITTHSPFILTSISNSVIYDLGNKEMYEDFSNYSYSNIIEGYFDSSSYSSILLNRLEKATEYLSKDEMTENEKQYVLDLDSDIEKLKTHTIPSELVGQWLNVKLKYFDKLNGQLS